MKNLLIPLAEIILIALEIEPAASPEDAGIHKKSYFGNDQVDNFKRRNQRYRENS